MSARAYSICVRRTRDAHVAPAGAQTLWDKHALLMSCCLVSSGSSPATFFGGAHMWPAMAMSASPHTVAAQIHVGGAWNTLALALAIEHCTRKDAGPASTPTRPKPEPCDRNIVSPEVADRSPPQARASGVARNANPASNPWRKTQHRYACNHDLGTNAT